MRLKQGEIVKVTGIGHPGIAHCLAIDSECVVIGELGSGYNLRGPHRTHRRKVNQIVHECHIERINPKNVSLKHLLDGDY